MLGITWYIIRLGDAKLTWSQGAGIQLCGTGLGPQEYAVIRPATSECLCTNVPVKPRTILPPLRP